MARYIAIMAGGIGSRFWPSSTEVRPKQFLDILGIGKSLIQMTFERSLALVPANNIYVLTNKRYKALVMEHLPLLPENNILCEPSMNNTAPCIAYTALKLKGLDPSASFAVVSSDHVIMKEDLYNEKLSQAFSFAENQDALITLGIQPVRPDTGYGYIETSCECIGDNDPSVGICKVKSFREKPDLITAEKYIASGQYLWNAGIFIWSVNSLIKALEDYAPDIMMVLSEDISCLNTPEEQDYIDKVYPQSPKISIDYAIMEKAQNVFTIPADIGWSDLGTWNSLHDYMEKDENLAVTIGDNTILIDTSNSIIKSDSDKIVVIKGLKDYIIVDEKEALLIYPKSDEQEIKQVVTSLQQK